jgi:murein DD-endopeptidase MepM/ murein hydrolase activator NlpD
LKPNPIFMKRWPSVLLALCVTLSLAATTPAAASRPTLQPAAAVGVTDEPPCDELTPAQEQAMWDEIQRYVAVLRRQYMLAAPDAAQAVTYNFPLRLAPGLPDYAGFRVSAFVDHNPASGPVLDYDGGARTYDGHHGTDYALWPFGWNKLDDGAMQVIAAAAGTLVAYSNGNPADHHCGPGSSGNWNYVALAHADGRMTIYGHLRYNSLTPKGLGQTVAQGEYLGTAASSGSSTGPHLHFEVRAASFSPVWLDPYAGPDSQPQSMWASQRPYFDSGINHLSTHSAPPSTPDACQPTLTNPQDSFTTPSTVYFYTYYRDYRTGLTTQFSIYRPDGSVFHAWQDVPDSNTFYSGAYQAVAYAFSAADPAGTWRFEAKYNSQVYETFFNVNAPPAVRVASPNGGEQWSKAFAHSLTWTDNLGGQVNIALYRNGQYSATLAYNAPSNGQYLWAPDSTLPPGPGYTIRVTSVTGPAVYDASDAPFGLTDAGLVARDDFALTPNTTAVTLDVLGNDDRPIGAPITITALGPPLSGTVSLSGAQVVYTPTLGLLGPDVFTYTVSTSTDSAQAAVTVLVVSQVRRLFLPAIRR